uniref:Putative structural protein n=1 Tax=viral metagenome TaxID=1070528 RepID=A0A6H1ZKH1_9ZZZZ
MIMDKLIDSIKAAEGYVEKIYLDTKDIPTCGWGHALLVGTKVPKEVCEIFLKQDVASAINDFYRLATIFGTDFIRNLSENRRRVLVEMIFNLGLLGFLKFVKMIEAIKIQDWEQAGYEMLDSKWHIDVGSRADRLADTFLEG